MLVEIITAWTQFMNEVSGGNAFLSGTLSLWVLTVVSYLCRHVPAKLWDFLKRSCTTSVTINNGGWEQEIVMQRMTAWLENRMTPTFTRTLSYESKVNDDGIGTALGMGFGVHLFFFKGRLFWLRKQKLESSGSVLEKFELTIGTIGRSHDVFKDILNEFSPKPNANDLNIYELTNNGSWDKITVTPKRPIESVAISSEIKDDIISQITHFKNNPEWFYKRAIPYKLSYILYGMPGTGKTSFIKAIASHFDMNVCIVNINMVSDKMLRTGFATTPKNSVIIIEDFDSSSITHDRGIEDYKQRQFQSLTSEEETEIIDDGNESGSSGNNDTFSMLTLTGFLNALDGIVPMDDCILFMTTNDIENIDPAILRKGRVDNTIEIGEIEAEDVREYVHYLFPDVDFSAYEFNKTIGCKIHDALLNSKNNVDTFINHMITNNIMIEKSKLYSIKKECDRVNK